MDNGITVGADIELEGNTTSDQIDESTIFFKGDFGKVEMGSKDSAGKQMHIGAPDASMVFANSTSLTVFVPFSGPTTFVDFAGDADRLTYFSPDFGGFQIGVSYARNNSQTNGTVNNNADAASTDFVDIGATYSGAVGGVDLGLSARWGTYDQGSRAAVAASAAVPGVVVGGVLTPTVDEVAAVTFKAASNPEIMGAGISLGFGDVSIGGGYTQVDTDDGVSDAKSYDVGISYTMGAMSYSLAYAHGETAGNVNENQVLVAAATYKVNSNFKVSVALSDVETKVVATGNKVEGTILSLSAGFSF